MTTSMETDAQDTLTTTMETDALEPQETLGSAVVYESEIHSEEASEMRVQMALHALELGANVNLACFDQYGDINGTSTAIYIAAYLGHVGVLNILLQVDGVDPNLGDLVTKDTPLRAAIVHNKLEAVKLLLQHGANPDVDLDGIDVTDEVERMLKSHAATHGGRGRGRGSLPTRVRWRHAF